VHVIFLATRTGTGNNSKVVTDAAQVVAHLALVGSLRMFIIVTIKCMRSLML